MWGGLTHCCILAQAAAHCTIHLMTCHKRSSGWNKAKVTTTRIFTHTHTQNNHTGLLAASRTRKCGVPRHPQCGAVPPEGLVWCQVWSVPRDVSFHLAACFLSSSIKVPGRSSAAPWSPSEGLLAARWPLNELLSSPPCPVFVVVVVAFS